MLQPHASMANYCTSGSESTNRELGSESILEPGGSHNRFTAIPYNY